MAKADKCKTTIKYELEIRGLEEQYQSITAHLYLGIRGQNGHVVTLFTNRAVANGTVHVYGIITKEDLQGVLARESLEVLLNEIDQGYVYINVHEAIEGLPQLIRGQLGHRAPCKKKCHKRKYYYDTEVQSDWYETLLYRHNNNRW